MKIKNLKFSILLFAILSICFSCEEDDGPTVDFNPEDRGEQQLKDKDSLLDYLASHYYNSSFFETGINHRIDDIEITKLDEGETSAPEGNTLLIDSENLETVVVDYLDVEYEYYILRLNQGGGEQPNFTDRIRVRYEGSNVDEGDVFDVVSTPEELNLQADGVNTGTIKAWQYVIPTFSTAENFSVGSDGITNYENFGLGVMFIPSGLGYFFGTQTGSAYANLIFKFELLQYEVIDHDGDGIPSHVENIDSFGTPDNDFDVFDDDTDGDGVADFVDFDDDGDGVATFNELIRTVYEDIEPDLEENEYIIDREIVNGVLTITTVKALDTDNNGVLDYLDADISINYNEDNDN